MSVFSSYEPSDIPADTSSDSGVGSIEVKIIRSASVHELIMLYKAAGWWESSWDENHDFLDHIVKDSAVFAAAFRGRKMIGMGRALSDLASDAYIQDVAVLEKYRGKGIGKKIVEKLVKKLTEHGVDWIGVVAQPGTSEFYEKIGFLQLKDHTPLKFKINQ